MLLWAFTILVLALIAGVLGFSSVLGTAAGMAKLLFTLLLVLFIISLVFSRKPAA